MRATIISSSALQLILAGYYVILHDAYLRYNNHLITFTGGRKTNYAWFMIVKSGYVSSTEGLNRQESHRVC